MNIMLYLTFHSFSWSLIIFLHRSVPSHSRFSNFKNIKAELLQSGHCDLDTYDKITAKCEELIQCSVIKKLKASPCGSRSNRYGIKINDSITIQHVYCVVIYCDLSDRKDLKITVPILVCRKMLVC